MKLLNPMFRYTTRLLLSFFLIAVSTPRGAFGEGTFQVIKVIDGDTIAIRNGKKYQPVRFIGIDAPEHRENDKAFRDADRKKMSIRAILKLGEKSYQHLTTLVKKGDWVRLEFDHEKSDRYGNRWYAYVYTKDGLLLNEKMAADGFATQMSVPPNISKAKIFTAAVASARAHHKGLWGEGLQ